MGSIDVLEPLPMHHCTQACPANPENVKILSKLHATYTPCGNDLPPDSIPAVLIIVLLDLFKFSGAVGTDMVSDCTTVPSARPVVMEGMCDRYVR